MRKWILVQSLALAHVLQVLNQLPHASDPGLCFLCRLCHKIQVASATTEHQREAPIGRELICNAEQDLRLVALPYCLHIAHRNFRWKKREDLGIGWGISWRIKNLVRSIHSYRWSGCCQPSWTCTRWSCRHPAAWSSAASSRCEIWFSSERRRSASTGCCRPPGYLNQINKRPSLSVSVLIVSVRF